MSESCSPIPTFVNQENPASPAFSCPFKLRRLLHGQAASPRQLENTSALSHRVACGNMPCEIRPPAPPDPPEPCLASSSYPSKSSTSRLSIISHLRIANLESPLFSHSSELPRMYYRAARTPAQLPTRYSSHLPWLSIAYALFCTLLHSLEMQLFCFQAIPHSL